MYNQIMSLYIAEQKNEVLLSYNILNRANIPKRADSML